MQATGKPTVLAVDDDPVILIALCSLLKNAYNIVPMKSGELALKYLQDKKADLVLLDMHMPGLTGFELLERIKENERTANIPVVFLTGSVADGSEAEAIVRGAADYIAKPIKPPVLLARISTHIELQRYRNKQRGDEGGAG